jgi:anti-sigma regulatory factor (Ser/Thr protein kinase)
MLSDGLTVQEDMQAKSVSRHPSEVPAARRFVRGMLAGHPAGADAELLACELVTNAVVHADGAGQVTVGVMAGAEGVHVEITDCGTAWVPHWHAPAADAESGRGFQLVDQIATRWGFLRDQAGTCCWFDLDHEP